MTTPRVGQLVALSWLIPCGVCRSCRRGHVWACPDSPSYRHTLLDGETAFRGDDPGERIRSYCAIATMAEASVVPAAAAIPVPDGTDPAVAALIGCCVTTGVGAVLKTAAVPAGATVAVIGLGGVGLSCVMGAALAGASRIVAIDRMPDKLAVARRGRGHGHAPRRRRCRRDARGPARPDRRRPRLRVRGDRPDRHGRAGHRGAPGRRHGRARRDDPARGRASFEVYPFVDGSRRILGSNYGFAEPAIDFPRYAAWTLDGRLPVERLIDRRIGLDDLEDAFDAMRARRYARQVIDFD